MLSPSAWTAYEWHWQPILFPCRSHPESVPWNRSVLLCQLARAPGEATPTTRQLFRTSRNDQSLRVRPGSHCAFSVQRACDLQCQWPLRTTGQGDPLQKAAAYSETETSDTARLCRAGATRFQTALHLRSPFVVRSKLYRD